jgi:hypothetical protein
MVWYPFIMDGVSTKLLPNGVWAMREWGKSIVLTSDEIKIDGVKHHTQNSRGNRWLSERRQTER